ncbi:MAG: hypothetical protein ABL925_20685 [Methylococcales bacterium]
MNKNTKTLLLSCLLLLSQHSNAAELKVPLQIDYEFIKKILINQVYKSNGQTAELWNDRLGCSYLKLSNPRIDGQKNQIHLLNQVQARFGTGLDGQCLTLLEWAGTLETFQQPKLESENSIVRFPVTQVNAYDSKGKQLTIDKLQDLIKRFAEPKLADLKIDLSEARTDIHQSLSKLLPQQNAAEVQEVLKTLKFQQVTANDKAIAVDLTFNASDQLAKKAPAPVFSAAEQQQWASAWQEWDAFLSKTIDQAAKDSHSEELRDTLTEILLDSRSSFQDGISKQNIDNADPVRAFFTRTWDRLAPVLKTVANDVPSIQGLRYITFIAATDVIYELEKFAAPFGLDISSDGLRRLGRILIAGKQQQTSTLENGANNHEKN